MSRKTLLKYSLVFISMCCYFFLYYLIEREEFLWLISGILILGGIYFFWLKKDWFSIKEIIVISILFRVLLLFDLPNFSDDFYRFYWDGNQISNGINPYEYTPIQLIDNKQSHTDNDALLAFKKLNSPNYFTVYPPINQLFFTASVFLGNGNLFWSVIFMKFFILLFEIGLIFFLFKMLRKLKLKESLAQIYAFNPLVVIELTGNVHFEGIMLFFLMLGVFLLMKNRVWQAGIFIGLAISVKLIPLMLLPFFLPLLGLKRSFRFYTAIAITCLLMLSPFLSQTLISNFSQSFDLYFQTFEFNASFYYLFKAISNAFLGYKSELIGTVIPLLVIAIIGYLTYRIFIKKGKGLYNKGVFDSILFMKYAGLALFVFYLLASTVHPWYIINIVVLCMFIKVNRVFLIWSIVVFISYFAYSHFVSDYATDGDFHKFPAYYLLVGLEYSIVLFFFIFDNKKNANENY